MHAAVLENPTPIDGTFNGRLQAEESSHRGQILRANGGHSRTSPNKL